MTVRRSKLTVVKEELDKYNILTPIESNTIDMFLGMDEKGLPRAMQKVMALFAMAEYVGHFKYKMKLSDTDIRPTNVIMFGLAKSGAGKTSSLKLMKAALKQGYNKIEDHREMMHSIDGAAAGVDADMEIESLTMGLSTTEGIAAKLARFQSPIIVGMPSLIIDEVANAFKANEDIVGNMRLIAEVFDAGDVLEKTLKDLSNATPALYNAGVSALFLGSEKGIMSDKLVMNNFSNEFGSKYARRCWFVYPEFVRVDEYFYDFDELYEMDLSKQNMSGKKMEFLGTMALNLAEKSLASMDAQKIIDVSPEMLRIHRAYKGYCEERGALLNDELLQLEMEGRDWKVIKAACSLSIFNGYETLHIEDYRAVVTMAEENAKYIKKFVDKAKRENYEVLVDYMIDNNMERLTFHELNKMDLANNVNKVKTLVHGANSLIGTKGLFKAEETGDVTYKDNELVNLDTVLCSYKALAPMNTPVYIAQGLDVVSATKQAKLDRVALVADGFTFVESTWAEFAELLRNDCAFSAFEYKDGYRSRDSVVSGAQFVAIDVDDSEDDINEIRDRLDDFNYHIAMTSNPNNVFKFRILLPFKTIVEINANKWQAFTNELCMTLGLEADILPQSQISFGYADRVVYSNPDGEALDILDIVKNAEAREPVQTAVVLSSEDRKLIRSQIEMQFGYAREGADKYGSKNTIFRVMAQAFDIGFTYQENIEICQEVMEIMPREIDARWLEGTLVQQRKKKYAAELSDMADAY